MPRLWYVDAVIYALDVDTFLDSNGDGCGDLAGVRERSDYLAGLGIECVWLQPIHPSGGRDNAYDVVDHYAIAPHLGSLGDFVQLIAEMDRLGIRVLIDLVVNHISNRHPWFRQARSDPGSPFRHFYIWADEPQDQIPAEPVFPGFQQGVWAYDNAARAYYLHHFYDSQPDLNIANSAVRDEIFKIVDFWLRLGVSGFRLDAAPFIVEKASWADPTERGHWFLRELYAFMKSRNPEAILLTESNVEADGYADFFCDGQGVELPLNFFVNGFLWLTLATSNVEPLTRALYAMPDPPEGCGYALWLRNHDELDLGRLSEEQREEVYQAFAPDPEMQLYQRGIRRRLAPMLGSTDRIKAAFSLLFSLPGVPVLLYGDEIGMGDDLSLPERDSVRTPMQWTDQANAGFSTAPRERLARPVVEEGTLSYKAVKVEAQSIEPGSVLQTVERLAGARRELRQLTRAEAEIIDVGSRAVLAVVYSWHDRVALCLTNISPEDRRARVDIGPVLLSEIAANRHYRPVEETMPAVSLGPWGFRWFSGRRIDEPAV